MRLCRKRKISPRSDCAGRTRSLRTRRSSARAAVAPPSTSGSARAASASAVNSLPMTDACSISARSSGSSRSSRAARSAWIVGGRTWSSSERSCSASIASICSRKSGFPSAASATRARVERASSRSPRTWEMSASESSSERPSRSMDTAFTLPPPQAGRSSRSSGRARHSTMMGASFVRSTSESRRSRSVGSAHWRSSNTRRRGRSRASDSSSLRIAQNVSSLADSASGLPTAAATRRAMRAASGVPPRVAAIASVEVAPAAARTTSASGQNVIPLPYGRQRPPSTLARPSTRAPSSAASRDLPMPAGPRSVTSIGFRSPPTCSKSCSSRASSRSRPTRGSSRRTIGVVAASEIETSRNACPEGSTETTSRRSSRAPSPTRISPGAAPSCRRAAAATASPVTDAPAMTSPVSAPARMASRTSRSLASSSFRSSSASRTSTAPRTALSESSSRTAGTPNTTSSRPAGSSVTVPPWSAKIAVARSSSSARRAARASGSRCSPSHDTSRKRTVTVFRASRGGGGASGEAPPRPRAPARGRDPAGGWPSRAAEGSATARSRARRRAGGASPGRARAPRPASRRGRARA